MFEFISEIACTTFVAGLNVIIVDDDPLLADDENCSIPSTLLMAPSIGIVMLL